jgi:hypothetical protein
VTPTVNATFIFADLAGFTALRRSASMNDGVVEVPRSGLPA